MDSRWIRVLRVGTVALAVGVVAAVGSVSRSASASEAPVVNLSTNQVFPDASNGALGNLRVTVGSSDLPVTVSLKRKGVVLQTKTVTNSGSTVSFATSTLRAGTYAVVASDGQDVTTRSVRVYRGWAPIDQSRPSWARCTTVTWSYDATGAPQGGSVGLVQDIKTTLQTLHEATGLTFTRRTTGGALVVRWGDAGGADGLGGLTWSTGPGTATQGFIGLNKSSQWAKTPGVDERGVLLLHEGSHALGLGHVDKDASLMSPTYRPGLTNSTLGSAEFAAYVQMYRPATCGT